MPSGERASTGFISPSPPIERLARTFTTVPQKASPHARSRLRGCRCREPAATGPAGPPPPIARRPARHRARSRSHDGEEFETACAELVAFRIKRGGAHGLIPSIAPIVDKARPSMRTHPGDFAGASISPLSAQSAAAPGDIPTTKPSGTVPGAASTIKSHCLPEITVIVDDDRELRGLQVHYLKKNLMRFSPSSKGADRRGR